MKKPAPKIDKPRPRRRTKQRPDEPCIQCDGDIWHICFHGIPGAKWGDG